VGVSPASPGWVLSPASDKNECSTVVSWLGRTTSMNAGLRRGSAQSLFRRAYDYAPDAAGLVGVPIQVWSAKSFTATWDAPLDANKPLVTADLTVSKAVPDWISGRVTSNLPAELLDVSLFYRGDYYGIDRLTPGVPLRVDDLRKSLKGRATAWTGAFSGWGSSRPIAGGQRYGQTVQATGNLMAPLLFRELISNTNFHNSGFRHLDESWRVTDGMLQTDEVIVTGRMAPQDGPAQTVAEDGVTASRLWLGQLPDGRNTPPALSGTLAQ